MNAPSATLYYLAVVVILTALEIADGQEADEKSGAEWDPTILLKMRSKASYNKRHISRDIFGT